MTANVIISFIIFNLLNVIIQTVKSIATIKCGKNVASIVNAIAYGLYTYIVVLTASDGINLWFKILVVALVNLVGVWTVKFFEEKGRKDKLWKIECTVKQTFSTDLEVALDTALIPYSSVDTNGKHTIFNIYCSTQEQSKKVKGLCEYYQAKYFVSETKIL